MAPTKATLFRMIDLGWTFGHPVEDIRKFNVINERGEAMGRVEDLMIDEVEHKARLLQVGDGGILGIGETRFLIPTQAITKIEGTTVYINQAQKAVPKVPVFDPELVEMGGMELECCAPGFQSVWGTGFMYMPTAICSRHCNT